MMQLSRGAAHVLQPLFLSLLVISSSCAPAVRSMADGPIDSRRPSSSGERPTTDRVVTSCTAPAGVPPCPATAIDFW